MTIRLTTHAAGALVAPAAYLGQRFDAYRTACQAAGARYSKDDKGNILKLDAIPVAVRHLEAAGFAVDVDDALRAALDARATVIETDVEEALARAERIDAELRSRGLALFPFQRLGVGWLAPRIGAGLFDEMGLGKTVQALTAAPAAAPILVVAPAVAKGTWVAEAARWRPDLRPTILRGRDSFRWPEAGEMVVTNYDILPNQAAGDPLPGTVLIADEAHALKNPRALRTVRFRALSRSVRAASGRVWLLTGTPLLGKPDELWHVLMAADLATEAFGTWSRFCELVGGYKGRFGMVWSGKISPDVPELLRRVSLQRRRVDVLPDLPTKIYRTIEVECVDDALRKLCDEVLATLRAYCDARGISLEAAIEEVMETKGGGVTFDQMSRVRHRLAIAKIPALIALVEEREEAGVPCVVFSRHRAPVEALQTRGGWGILTGDQTGDERTSTVAAFQAGKLRGIAATIQAGGVAITLTHANEVLFVDLDWTPALNQQAEDRVCRIGQTRGVIVTRIQADHELDAHVNRILDRKQQLISATVEASAVLAPAPSEDHVRALREAAGRSAAPEPEPARPARRGPGSPVEEWAASALRTLACLDPDHAGVVNDVGFNRMDGVIGHSLAEQLDRGLTEKQWPLAVRIAMHYPRQVGRQEVES